jgi:RND family efflux transporter MFP subunit
MTAMTRTRARRTTALVATACLALAVGCKKADPASADSTAAPVVAAKTVAATTEPFTHTVTAIGTVVARPGRFAALSAPVATRISRVYVAAGQRVAEGQPLVEFEQVGFNAAASGAQAALTAAERNYERATRLANEGIVPRKDAEQAAADLGRARTEAVTARRAQQLSVLRSPVSGVVTRMAAVLGAAADPAQVLVEVADPSAFDVVLSLGPSEAGAVHQGARVTLSAGEKTGGESIGTGLVASVGASLDTASRSVAIRVTTTSTRRPLRMGESVFGEIATQVIPNAVVVPVEALVPGDEVGTYRLFVVDRTGTAMGRDVKVGGRTETKAEIVEGLKAGELVVTQGAFAVQDSAKVARPTPAAP